MIELLTMLIPLIDEFVAFCLTYFTIINVVLGLLGLPPLGTPEAG